MTLHRLGASNDAETNIYVYDLYIKNNIYTTSSMHVEDFFCFLDFTLTTSILRVLLLSNIEDALFKFHFPHSYLENSIPKVAYLKNMFAPSVTR